MNVKKYEAMTAEEQERWVSEFAEWAPKGRELAKMTAGWTKQHTTDMEQGLELLAAWPFAQDFCEKARRYGDYDRRAYRLPVYIDKVTEKLADGLTMTDEQGKVVAFVSPSAPMRRRGRPTKEEVAARLRGDAVAVQGGDDAEARKRKAIARMLGLEVVVSGDAPREKNNAELKAEREAKKAEEERRNPSLFRPSPDPSLLGRGVDSSEQQDYSRPSIQGGDGGGSLSPCAQLMSDSYEMRMAQDKLHLNQLAWMLSPELAKRTETVQSLRVTSESASERAKTMADMGAKPEDIEPYTKQAKEATEAYLAIYKAVDEELAVLHKRLYLDVPFVEKFKQRFKGVDIEKVQYITRPYYEKMRKESPEIDVRIRTVIEQESPEYAAKMKAEEEKKKEVAELLRYLKRKDKPNVKQRIETMEKRYVRLVELLGEEEAKVYRPIVDAAREDYEKNYRPTPAPSLNGGEKAEKAQPTKPVAKKSANKATKQEIKKATKK